MKVVIGRTVQDARVWCEQNGLDPRSRDVLIAAVPAQAVRGRQLKREDVVWLPGSELRDDYEAIVQALEPAFVRPD